MRILVVSLWLSALLAAQGQSDVPEVVRQGARLVEAGQLAAAAGLYEKALSSYPGDPDLTF